MWLFGCPRNCEPLYSSEVATPGWWVLIGGGGIREAEDVRAALLQHSARTGMMSANACVSPTATVMNHRLRKLLIWRGATDQQYLEACHFTILLPGLRIAHSGRVLALRERQRFFRQLRITLFDWLDMCTPHLNGNVIGYSSEMHSGMCSCTFVHYFPLKNIHMNDQRSYSFVLRLKTYIFGPYFLFVLKCIIEYNDYNLNITTCLVEWFWLGVDGYAWFVYLARTRTENTPSRWQSCPRELKYEPVRNRQTFLPVSGNEHKGNNTEDSLK